MRHDPFGPLHGGNVLNEIGQRGTLPTHVSGTVATGSSVTANGIVASVIDNYWDTALPVSTNGTYYSQLAVSASNGGQTANTTVPALLRPSSEAYTYDADGNVLSDSLWNYTWDAEDRLVGMSTTSAATTFGAPAYQLTFKYDYLGRRVEKTVVRNGTTTLDRKYLYQGSLLVAEIDAASNQIVQSYTWGPDASGTIGGEGGIGGLLLVTTETTTTLSGYDVSYDGNGNVAALLSTADGSLAATYEYDAYGQMVRRQGVEADANPFQFSTKFTDNESGLVYFGRRFYDPSAGRFINRDPAEEAGGLNLFRYVGGDPINAVDPFGLGSTTIAGAAAQTPIPLPAFDQALTTDADQLMAEQADEQAADLAFDTTISEGEFDNTFSPAFFQSLLLNNGTWGPNVSSGRTTPKSKSNTNAVKINVEELRRLRKELKAMSETWNRNWQNRALGDNPFDVFIRALDQAIAPKSTAGFSDMEKVYAAVGGPAYAAGMAARKANPNQVYIPAPASVMGTRDYYLFRSGAAPASYTNGTGGRSKGVMSHLLP